jgi:segregation and condensation protein B
MNLDIQLEGLLFYKASPVKISALAKLLQTDEETLKTTAITLAKRLSSGGTRLLQTETELQLVTAPELDELIEGIRRDEMKRDIGKAGAETLAIILYRGPISRAEIDRIRGVNSSFIIRNLLVRGLIAREQTDKRTTFSVTPALLAHLGVTHQSEVVEYSSVLDKLEAFEKTLEPEPV